MSQQLLIFNTAGRRKEPFVPQSETIGMYCCGPTVYNYAHIGNLRTYIFEDVLKRTLLSLGYKVHHVVNITDVGHLTSDEDTGEDKMEKGALREGKTVWQIAAYYTEKFFNNIKDLQIMWPDVWPKATDHINEMITMVETLEKKGFTYRTNDGIYFDTTKFDRYCDFAQLDPQSLRAGTRVDMGDKKNVTDFALWKFSPRSAAKRQMEWESPWGVGFPGWHIECSAMSLKYLPQPIDIHCGGMDHVRVHHTNEIAQAEAATGRQFVRYWVHGEFLTMVDAKMAKSGDNFITLEKLKERAIDPLAYRMFCYTAHYRSPLAFSWEGLLAAAQSLKNLRRLVAAETSGSAGVQQCNGDDVGSLLETFFASIYDDLNMPKAMAAIWEMLRNSQATAGQKSTAVRRADEILALNLFKNEDNETVTIADDSGTMRIVAPHGVKVNADEIFAIVYNRREARKMKDFAKADTLRKELTDRGVELKDIPGGITECIVNAIKKDVISGQ